MMRYIKLSILIFFMLLLLNACSQKPRSLWQEGVISVMADEADWEGIQGALKSTYEKVVRTPQEEYQFQLFYVPDSLIDYYSRAHFLMVASTLNSKGRIGEMVQKITSSPSVRQSIEDGENFLFVRRNEWARDQVMIILVSSDIPTLRKNIEDHSILLYDLMKNEMKDYLTAEVLDRRENKELSEQLMERYGWTMRIQADYFLAEAFPEDNFLWMRRVSPDRWIFVHWVDNADTSLLNQEWVVSERNRIGKTYYHDYQEQVVDRYLFSYKSTFQGRSALITTGLWERIDDTAGGPFKNYTFYDEAMERIFMVDVGLFAPGKEKMPYLRRIEVIAETFRTRFDPEL